MPAIVNVADFIKVGIFALIFIWLADKALGAAGLNQFQI